MIVIAIVAGVVLCVFTVCFFNYKENELEYKKKENEYALYIEKEHTDQNRIDWQKEAEKTKQLQIKADYKQKTGRELYKFLNS